MDGAFEVSIWGEPVVKALNSICYGQLMTYASIIFQPSGVQKTTDHIKCLDFDQNMSVSPNLSSSR